MAGTVAALPWSTWAVRTWMQGSHTQASAATVRLTLDPSGTPMAVDWAISAGTVWDSTDDLLADWNTALDGYAYVEIVPDVVTHRGHVRVRTESSVTYSIAWSHSGDGTAVRDRLGESGDVSGRAHEAVWTGPVLAAWYSWHGATKIARPSTRTLASRRSRLDGQMDTQHHNAAAELVELDVELRFGTPPSEATVNFGGHYALEAFLDELWSATGGGEPWALHHLPDDVSAPQSWRVAFTTTEVSLRPTRVPGTRPGWLWDMPLSLVAESSPW